MKDQKEDIVDKLEDLIVQATQERSHYYVESAAREALYEIRILRSFRDMVREEVGKMERVLR